MCNLKIDRRAYAVALQMCEQIVDQFGNRFINLLEKFVIVFWAIVMTTRGRRHLQVYWYFYIELNI